MECKKLITARKNKGLTQKQVADKMAMEQTTYSKKERGLSPIREDEWMRFAKILEVNIEDIKEIRTKKEEKKITN
ncbi:helix-turn-helix domain-containing protein [Flavobacterium macrobrachii]|jgi:transcriptional regulator with XRE-family HTH domain|uniref:helix-turn-helix domain-containing protein n=1 Tax=Flavobacterium macrobrachii TaxID=591204 RepID=UPI0037C04B31